MSQIHYLPLVPGFFAILVGFFFIVLILRSVRMRMKVSVLVPTPRLFYSLPHSSAAFSTSRLRNCRRSVSCPVSREYFHMRHVVAVVSELGRYGVAVNVGGAVIPTLVSIYLFIKRELSVEGLLATVIALGDPLDGRSRSRPWHRGADIHARPDDSPSWQ